MGTTLTTIVKAMEVMALRHISVSSLMGMVRELATEVQF